MADDFSPMYVGDLSPVFAPTFKHKDQTAQPLVGLQPSDFTMRMRNLTGDVTKTCSGPWTIDDAAAGFAHYEWQPTDTDTAGVWLLQVELILDGKPMHTDETELEILEVL